MRTLNLNLLGLAVLVSCSYETPTQVLLEFDFDAQTLQPSFAAPRVNLDQVNTGFSSYSFIDQGSGDYSFSLHDNGSPFDVEPGMITQSLSIEPGYVMNISRITFEGKSGAGNYWDLALAAFNPALSGHITVPLQANQADYDVPITDTGFQGITSLDFTYHAFATVSFEEPFGFINSGYSTEFDNVTVFGSITPVPEPKAAIWTGLTLLCFCFAIRRSHARKQRATKNGIG